MPDDAAQRTHAGTDVGPPPIEVVADFQPLQSWPRLPRRLDFAARDEANRKLGRAGEQWTLQFGKRRLADAGLAGLFERVDCVADRLGNGTGYDILSYRSVNEPRCIEVKTTNGAYLHSFIISRNEIDFSQEAGDAFLLHRLFAFRESPALCMLQEDVSKQLHLEPLSYRASFQHITKCQKGLPRRTSRP